MAKPVRAAQIGPARQPDPWWGCKAISMALAGPVRSLRAAPVPIRPILSEVNHRLEPDAGNPAVRFGGRGDGQPLPIPIQSAWTCSIEAGLFRREWMNEELNLIRKRMKTPRAAAG